MALDGARLLFGRFCQFIYSHTSCVHLFFSFSFILFTLLKLHALCNSGGPGSSNEIIVSSCTCSSKFVEWMSAWKTILKMIELSFKKCYILNVLNGWGDDTSWANEKQTNQPHKIIDVSEWKWLNRAKLRTWTICSNALTHVFNLPFSFSYVKEWYMIKSICKKSLNLINYKIEILRDKK